MGFVNNQRNNFVSTKLTSKGREKIAKGKLKFQKWAIGDSEINYQREKDNSELEYPYSQKILLPTDNQPDLKYFISRDVNLVDNKKLINASDMVCVKLTTNNLSKERGIFDLEESITQNKKVFNDGIFKGYADLLSANISGSVITMESAIPNNVKVGDWCLIEMPLATPSTFTLNGLTVGNFSFYKIKTILTAGVQFGLDRDVNKVTGVNTRAFFFSSSEVQGEPMWSETPNFEWDGETFNYEAGYCQGLGETKVWDFNIIKHEELAGYFNDYEKIGDKYIGLTNNYLGYNNISNYDLITDSGLDDCDNTMVSGVLDNHKKFLGVIHYTNSDFANIYGDFFYVNHSQNKRFKIKLPGVLHPNSDDLMGLTIVSNGNELKVTGTDITYYNLIVEGTTEVVGRVFNNLKIAILHDEEIVTALSFGGGRNFTLPMINSNLKQPLVNGGGILGVDQKMYITYLFEGVPGASNKVDAWYLHCNNYNVITNNTPTKKNVELSFNDISKFKHMLKTTSTTADLNKLFTANKFKVLYQITNKHERPSKENWKVVDFTTSGLLFTSPLITSDVINPSVLVSTKFDINEDTTSSSYVIDPIGELIPFISLGDENILFGNISTYAGATIYKSIIQVKINPTQYKYTTNTTKVGVDTPLKVSEVGIYDDEEDLIMIGKLATPIELNTSSTIMLELNLDF